MYGTVTYIAVDGRAAFHKINTFIFVIYMEGSFNLCQRFENQEVKVSKKKLVFLEILCKYGNYLCKHGNPLYKQEIILQYELKVLFYIFSNVFSF